MDGGMMADKMFFIKVPDDLSEEDHKALLDMMNDIADKTERKGSRWGFAVIPEHYDPMSHAEVQTFLKELLAVARELLGPEKILEMIERCLKEKE
jgi:hypothetical protein